MLSDVVMPGGSGPDTAKLVLETRPGLRIIYVSGFTDQAIRRELDEQGAVFLQKPFALDFLGGKIRSLLNGKDKKMEAKSTQQTCLQPRKMVVRKIRPRLLRASQS